ncbi:MAG: hypothetical protein PUF67_06430, partial [Firmicutes bacterium]|nr:hypothetical protein [Bacillota bacterium]
MVITLLPVNTLADENNSSKEPDVSVFATKEQLMDGTFAPNEKGVPENIGKIVFGINAANITQEWYILGKDTGVSGDNTIIFAASPIAIYQKFSSDTSTKTYNYEAGTGYGDSAGSTTVYANHYGASDLRVVLQGMATNTYYFTTAEQGLMNATTVTTKDTNKSVTYTTYTTTDKLYALLADNSSPSTIKAGTSDSTVLAMNSYWSSGERFWLRSPDDHDDREALFVLPGVHFTHGFVENLRAVQPASNLNLNNVLFTSAAMEGSSGALASDAAMYLRFDGSNNESLGSICYTDDEIYVHFNGECVLFVQGKNGDQNWVYNTCRSGDYFIVTKQNIIDELKLESLNITDIDLSQCKMWIETKETDGLIYAVEAKQAISSVDINIDVPVDGENLDQTATTKTTGVTGASVSWDTSDTIAAYDKKYKASLILSPKDGYEFLYHYNIAEDRFVKTSVTVNGNEISNDNISIDNDGKLVVTYEFKTLDTLIRVCDVDTIEVANGTSLEDI